MTAARSLVAVLLVGALMALMAGCSDDPYADYCEVVTAQQAELTKTLDEGGPDALLKALPIFRDLQDAAPSDLRDDWKIVVDGLAALEAALDDADVDPATYDRDNPPDGVSDAERDRIDAAADELRSADSKAAFAAVEQQARDVCQAPLRL